MKRVHFLCLDDMVPQNHSLRAIEESIDWSFIYGEAKWLYVEERWGNPGIDPVSLIKIVMMQYIYGIPSMQQTIREIVCICEQHGFVQDFEVAPANLHRRVTFNDLYRRITENYPTSEAVAVDAGYKISSTVNTKATLKYARITHFYPPVR